MVVRRPAYPFVPKSSAYLLPGHFWGVPLRDGRFACGVVVAIPTGQDVPQRAVNGRTFVAGLLDWSGDDLPSPAAVGDRPLLAWGFGHIKMIGTNGGAILGRRSVPAGVDGALELPVGTWGFRYVVALADRAFVDGGPIARAE
ncbi:hypothetical protein [Kribbella sp. NPDC048928]|uniref:hypothetical protein n=1 Tax=Kribbella sp. NPDC048928 TaxID=3364111 RepID=UPI00371DBAA9